MSTTKKILCVPVLQNDGWDSPVSPALAGTPLLAFIDETGDPRFEPNPLASEDHVCATRSGEVLRAGGAIAVIASDASPHAAKKLMAQGIAVLEMEGTAKLSELHEDWLQIDLDEQGCCGGHDGAEGGEGGCCGGHGHAHGEGGGCGGHGHHGEAEGHSHGHEGKSGGCCGGHGH